MTAAQRIAAELDAAGRIGFGEWSRALQGFLADEVETRHTPPVEHLDGWRDRESMAAYLEEEVRTFPRAFGDDFETRIAAEDRGDGTVLTSVAYVGTLLPDGPPVDVAVSVDLEIAGGEVVKIHGGFVPETDRDELIAWLKAVERIGGFNPPAAQRI